MNTSADTRTVYFTMVCHPVSGWMRVGKPYLTRKVAQSWLSFVKKAWRGLPVKVEPMTVTYIDGQVSDESRRTLSEQFNMDVED